MEEFKRKVCLSGKWQYVTITASSLLIAVQKLSKGQRVNGVLIEDARGACVYWFRHTAQIEY